MGAGFSNRSIVESKEDVVDRYVCKIKLESKSDLTLSSQTGPLADESVSMLNHQKQISSNRR